MLLHTWFFFFFAKGESKKFPPIQKGSEKILRSRLAWEFLQKNKIKLKNGEKLNQNKKNGRKLNFENSGWNLYSDRSKFNEKIMAKWFKRKNCVGKKMLLNS